MRQSSRTLLVGAVGVAMILSALATGVVGQGSQEPDAAVSPNLIQPPTLDDSRIVTAEEERELTARAQSSAGAANGGIQIDGQPVMTASPPLMIHASAFKSDGFFPDSFGFSFSGGYLSGSAQQYGCVMAQADLPSGVTVTDMFTSVWDNEAGEDIFVSLSRIDNFTGTVISMASASTSGTFAGIQTPGDSTIIEPVIVYPDYSYYVTTCLWSASIRLYSVRLNWSIP